MSLFKGDDSAQSIELNNDDSRQVNMLGQIERNTRQQKQTQNLINNSNLVPGQ